ncbi:hypothetical protein BY996DRAFT_2899135 [Phakopsora pachyrhizi]|uniref:Expressed protein n=1 Tax=Phakopsora pachyrhizi TaxID=170000 RepID=A0AAV0BLC6_PHAPC|nr:hypothetical protein BY996DRAFT_2899135 [Phakopsora pachyrhizi]CAH7687524.1 expressed protein [Phakopsora pachyrhizi]
MLQSPFSIVLLLSLFAFSKPSPGIFHGAENISYLGDKCLKTETSVKNILTPISKIPFFNKQVLNEKVSGARSFAIYADFHKTLISPDGKNWEQICSLLTEVSKSANILISSRGRNEKMVSELKDIPGIIISEELGMRVTKAGKTTTPFVEEVKKFETIKKITYEVIKSEIANLNLEGFDDIEKTFVFAEKTFKLDFPPSLSRKNRAQISKKVDESISLNKEVSHWKTIYSNGDSLRYFASQKCSKVNVLKEYLLSNSKNYDMMISLGNGDADEEVHKYMNENNFLSIIVRNEGKKKMESFAQYRVNDNLCVYKMLENFIDIKKKEKLDIF